MIKAKAAGETVERSEPAAKPTSIVDLVEALHASVERARSPKDTGEKASTSHTARGQRPAPKKRASSTSRGGSLQSVTQAELYDSATQREPIVGYPTGDVTPGTTWL
ncbi:hypothetical protein [Streptomyces sp. NPDC006971]|uniref:hypothetical protein n=1 Tax=Streptomyces sp. NPDC006971 TaxID=3154784 RepID=UPI0033F1B2D8